MQYDATGNRTRLTASLPGAPASYSNSTTYQYDNPASTDPTSKRGQLTAESNPRVPAGGGSFAYAAAGNPTSFRSAGSIGYNANNQLSGASYTYDGSGNPTTYPLTSGSNGCSYDLENRLVRLDNTNTTTMYGYRADGLRAWKQVLNKAGGVGENGAHKGGAGTNGLTVVLDGLTYFLYDGGSVIAELDSNGGLTAVNTWGATGLLSRQTVSGNTSSVYVFDPQGNVARRLDGNGTVKGSYVFDAWGAKRTTNDASPDCYCGYGGQWGNYADAESGLTLCGHRYYDSNTGRWLTRDPIGYEGGINLYGYVGNNASNEIDPDGLIKIYVNIGENGWGEVNAVYEAGDLMCVNGKEVVAKGGEKLFSEARTVHNIPVKGDTPIPSGTYGVGGYSDHRANSPYRNRWGNKSPSGHKWVYGPGTIKFDGLGGKELHGFNGKSRGKNRSLSTPTEGCIRGENETISALLDALERNIAFRGTGPKGKRHNRLIIDSKYDP